jgi:predicted dehydrogenase
MFSSTMAQNAHQKIRYGIIGFGGFAERAIAPAIRACSNSELVAIQKRSLDAATQKAAEHNIPRAFDSVEQLVSDSSVDAVFIVSANAQHCPETITAARAKKHVLVEKPMALNVLEAKNMVNACKRNRVKLMVGHMIRFSPLAVRIKEIIQSGLVGRVTFAKSEFIYDGRTSERQWLLNQRIAGGGPLWDVGVHCLDTLRFVLDDEVVSVKSHLQPVPTKTKTESTADVSMRFSRGVLASIYCSYDAPIRRSTIEIIGTEGTLFAPHFTRGEMSIPLTITIRRGDKEAETSTEEIRVPNLYVEEINHFSDCILNNRQPLVPGEVGLENQKILDSALRGGTTAEASRGKKKAPIVRRS